MKKLFILSFLFFIACIAPLVSQTKGWVEFYNKINKENKDIIKIQPQINVSTKTPIAEHEHWFWGVWALISRPYSESYISIIVPMEQFPVYLEFSSGLGIETAGENVLRTGHSIYARYAKLSFLTIQESGLEKGEYWSRYLLKYQLGDLDLGIHYVPFTGVGPYVAFNRPNFSIWATCGKGRGILTIRCHF